MKEENEALLQQQRRDIVQQVMQNLRDAGVMVASPSDRPGLRSSRSRSPAQRLEQNLHSLVTHSLAESGLNFPHVQRSVYAGSDSLRHPIRTEDRRAVVVARVEGAGGSQEEQDSVVPDDIDAEAGALERRQKDTTRRAQAGQSRASRGSRTIQNSPLVAAARKSERCKKDQSEAARGLCKPKTSCKSLDDADEDGEDVYTQASGPVDAAFNRVRSKVDQRTLAILDKSKALLNQTRDAKRSIENGDGGGRTFVDRMREMRIANTEEASSRAEHDELATDKVPRVIDELEIAAPDPEAVHQQLNVDNLSPRQASSRQSAEHHQPGSPTRDEIRCDIDLLRPPERSPENEDEWENELARQILTIYATSVKAKAAGVESGGGDGAQRNAAESAPSSVRPRPGSSSKAVGAKGRRSMESSCSLPSLNAKSVPAAAESQARQPRSTASVHYSWQPSQRLRDGKVVINMPKVPRPIWFAGTGAVKAVWCALAQAFPGLHPQRGDGTSSSEARSQKPVSLVAVCEHRLCEEVRRMEAKLQFGQCIATLESLLVSLVRARGVGAFEAKLWKQLVVTCNAFASRCIDYKKFTPALQLIKQAEQLVHNSILVDAAARFELMAFLYDTYAHYYYRKRKPHAGLQYILKAHEIHSKQTNWSHLAKCRLHTANLLSFQLKHQEAMAYMASILEMIEQNKLEDHGANGEPGDGASAQKICLAAVCYNNLAVEQLHLREFEAASVSSANAKRLARLCLSYSNRWLSQFEATSSCAALAIATLMEDANAPGTTRSSTTTTTMAMTR